LHQSKVGEIQNRYQMNGLRYDRRNNMLVSVIIPVYNGEKYIGEAIDSILNQTFRDFELLIINDCSTDKTVSVINKYRDKRIKLINNDKNLGLAGARNVGIDNAKGKYIAWLDSDDISLNTRLEKQINLLENNPSFGLCGTWVKTIGSTQQVWKCLTQSELIKSTMLFNNCFATSSVMLRKEILTKNRYLFDLDYPTAEDYDLWEKISHHCEVTNIPEVLTYYRVHTLQTTFSEEARKKQLEFAWNVQKRILQSLNIFPNEKEKEIHLKIVPQSNIKFDIHEEIKYIYEWLEKLYLKNGECKQFSDREFKKSLNNNLYSICSVSKMVLPYCHRSPYRVIDVRFIYRLIKLVAKSLVKS